MTTSNSKETNKLVSSIIEKATLKRLLGVVSESLIYSFAISESVFLYFLARGIARFPENIIVSVAVLTIGLGVISALRPLEVVFLTSPSAVVTMSAIDFFLFGSSTSVSFGSFLDRVLYGTLWPVFLYLTYGYLKKRKISRIHGYSLALGSAAVAITVLLYFYSAAAIDFFDSHPWLVTILVGAVSSILAYLAGRSRKRAE